MFSSGSRIHHGLENLSDRHINGPNVCARSVLARIKMGHSKTEPPAIILGTTRDKDLIGPSGLSLFALGGCASHEQCRIWFCWRFVRLAEIAKE